MKTQQVFCATPGNIYYWKCTMTKNPLRLTVCCACLLLIGAALIVLPAGAFTLDPAGSGSSNIVTIANGDSVMIHGIATGHPRNGLQLWIISHNYLKVTTLAVNDDNTYVYELKPADTQNLASGEYFFLVQHPMMNGRFDVVYDPSTGKIINKQLDGGKGMEIFTISGSGSLQGPDSAQALVKAIGSQNIDDTFATYSFYISPPTTLINPIGDHYVGDKFTISGFTNLAAGDELMVEVTSSSFKPTEKAQSGEFSGVSGTVKVVPGSSGYNHWSFDMDATTFKPDEYIVKVSGITQDVTGSTYFTIVNGHPPVSATTTVTVPDTTAIPATTLPPLTPTTTPKSPFPCWIAIGALAVMACMRKRS
jgi:trimeric autotransporter adhesin